MALVAGSALFGVRFSYGVFFKSIQAEFDLTRTVTSSVYSAYLMFCAVFSVLGGWAIDKYGPRRVVFALGLITGLSLILVSRAQSLWQLFLTYSLLLAVGTGAPVPLLSSVVSRWFDRKRGLALGISTSATGLGIVVIAPLAAYLISSLGWRTAYVYLALVIWLVVVSLSLLMRRDPAEMGLLPDGAGRRGGPVPGNRDEKPLIPNLPLSRIFRIRNFWLILGTWTLWGVCVSLINTHLIPYITDKGISAVGASTVLSLASGLQIVFQLGVGRISDTIGRKIPGVVCALSGAFGLIWLSGARELSEFYLFALFFGFASGGVFLINLVLASDTFRERNIGVIMGLLNVGWTIGNAFGSALGGIIFDATGSYFAAFGTAAGAMLIIAGIFILVRKRKTEVSGVLAVSG